MVTINNVCEWIKSVIAVLYENTAQEKNIHSPLEKKKRVLEIFYIKKNKTCFLVKKVIFNNTKLLKTAPCAAGPALFRLHPQKKLTIYIVLTIPILQKPGRNRFFGKLIKDLGILKKKNKLQTIWLIWVQGDFEYIFLLLVVCFFKNGNLFVYNR